MRSDWKVLEDLWPQKEVGNLVLVLDSSMRPWRAHLSNFSESPLPCLERRQVGQRSRSLREGIYGDAEVYPFWQQSQPMAFTRQIQQLLQRIV